nr:retrovirus-related Pol polyprotein from transposon TNT 1-94 [Tanacetum cinerariifolium]
MKAKLALLEASPSTSQSSKPFQSKNKGLVAKNFDWDEKEVSNVEEITQVRVLMALADYELSVGKNYDRNVQRLLEAHLAHNSSVQVNKIASLCEICSGPHYTQYYMENPEQAFVDYASSCTDEAADMEKDPASYLLVGKGFLATASAVIDCKKTKITVGEGVTRLIFEVKEIDLDGIGARHPYYAKKDFMDYHFPKDWEMARDAELNPFKDVLVLRRMVEFLGVVPINLKGNMWESKEPIDKRID